MTVTKPDMKYVGSPFFSSREGTSPEAIVLHIAEGTLAGVDSWFNNPAAEVSAHFCVGKTGEIHQYIYLENAAWANGKIEAGYTAALIDENGGMNPNRWTVSIEHEGFYAQEPTADQFEASAQLSAWLFDSLLLTGGATDVAIDRKHILRHADISPKNKGRCPGWSDLTIARYIARVREIVAGPPSVDPRLIQARDLLNAVIGESK